MTLYDLLANTAMLCSAPSECAYYGLTDPVDSSGVLLDDEGRDDVPTLLPASPCSWRSDSSLSSDAPEAEEASDIPGESPREAIGDLERKYDVVPGAIGTGYFSSVRECVDRFTGRRCAVKTILKDDPAADLRNVAREIDLLRRMDHPHIVRLVDACEDAERVDIVTELCEGGELYDRIVERSRRGEEEGGEDTGAAGLPGDRAARIMRQILSAVSYMHDHHVVHRDIKPENVLFLTRDPDSPVKIIDFGLSRTHLEGMEPRMRTLVGTPHYLAPEVLRGRYTRSCDLWSAGVTAYVTLCGRLPFDGDTNEDVYDAILWGGYRFRRSEWEGTTREARDFVRRLLRSRPRRRPTADRALEHPWIADRADRDEEGGMNGDDVREGGTFVEVVFVGPSERKSR